MEKKILDEERDRGMVDGWYERAGNFKKMDDAFEFVKELFSDYQHDYGTTCHAISASALAVASAAASERGITGFQAGCIFWGFAHHWLLIDGPAKLVRFQDLLYPQYEQKFSKTISRETAEWLQDAAKKKLENGGACEAVSSHWARLAAGEIPFGFSVESDDSQSSEAN